MKVIKFLVGLVVLLGVAACCHIWFSIFGLLAIFMWETDAPIAAILTAGCAVGPYVMGIVVLYLYWSNRCTSRSRS